MVHVLFHLRVVTDERKTSLQPTQVAQGDQNGYPKPGGIAGPPSPGVYTIGWEMGDRPTTCHNKRS